VPRHTNIAAAKANMIKKGVWPISVWPGRSDKPWLCVCMTCREFVTPCHRNVMQPGRGGCNPCAQRASAAKRRIRQVVAVKEMRAAGVEPLESYPGVDVPWRCRCLSALCPGLWMGDPADIRPRLSDARRSTKTACKYCSHTMIRTERAVQQMIQGGVRPLDPGHFPGARERWKCECMRCKRVVSPIYANVVLAHQGGCDYCGGRKRIPEARAVSEMLAAGVEPLEPYPTVNARWKCRCLAPDCPGPKDRVIYPRLGWVRRGAQACKWCAGVIIDPDAARDVMISVAGLVPQEPYPGVRERWKCYCPKHRGFVYPTLGSVNSRGSGCQDCAETGFRNDKPAQVYLISSLRLSAAKVGICNVGTGRVAKHEGRGWRLFKATDFAAGGAARTVEREVLAEWRAQGWQPVRDGGATYDGYTETAPLSQEVSVESLWRDIKDIQTLLADRR
jgi:hypothetical protein